MILASALVVDGQLLWPPDSLDKGGDVCLFEFECGYPYCRIAGDYIPIGFGFGWSTLGCGRRSDVELEMGSPITI